MLRKPKNTPKPPTVEQTYNNPTYQVHHASTQPVHQLGQATPVGYIQTTPSTHSVQFPMVAVAGMHPDDIIQATVALDINGNRTSLLVVLYPEGDVDVYRDGQPAFIRRVDEGTLTAYEHIRQQIADTGSVF